MAEEHLHLWPWGNAVAIHAGLPLGAFAAGTPAAIGATDMAAASGLALPALVQGLGACFVGLHSVVTLGGKPSATYLIRARQDRGELVFLGGRKILLARGYALPWMGAIEDTAEHLAA